MNSDSNPTDRGFTLIELLIVIVVLGVLATVAILAMSGVTSRASKNACQLEQASLVTALESYMVTSAAEDYPTAASDGALVAILMSDATPGGPYFKHEPQYAFTYDASTGSIISGAPVGATASSCDTEPELYSA